MVVGLCWRDYGSMIVLGLYLGDDCSGGLDGNEVVLG